jgi:phospholipid transport system substrate-binding protein
MRLRVLSKLLWSGAVLLGLTQMAAASDVTAPIEQLDAGLLQVMKAGKGASFQQRYDVLAPLVTRAIDLDAILEGAVGSAWALLAPDQQAALKAAFQHYSVATYVAHFDDFDGERFDLTAPAAGGAPVVRVRIVPGKPGDETHTLGYTMRQTPAGWKAIDVTADSDQPGSRATGRDSRPCAQQRHRRSLHAPAGEN